MDHYFGIQDYILPCKGYIIGFRTFAIAKFKSNVESSHFMIIIESESLKLEGIRLVTTSSGGPRHGSRRTDNL